MSTSLLQRKEKEKRMSTARMRNVERLSSHPSLSGRSSRMSFIANFTNEISLALDIRKQMKITEGSNTDVTPKLMIHEIISERLETLVDQIRAHCTLSGDGNFDSKSIGTISYSSIRNPSAARLGAIGGMKLSMEDVIFGIGSGTLKFDSSKSSISQGGPETLIFTKFELPYIKVMLQISDTFVLYGQRSLTMPKNTRDGNEIEEDNKKYDYLTLGKGKVRRRSDAETQTKFVLSKTRRQNTRRTNTADKASYVSYFEMYDTLQQVAATFASTKSIEVDAEQSAGVTLSWDAIKELPSFKHASMVIKRLLAGNVFEEEQQRFRNMTTQNRLDLNLEYTYTLCRLFQYPAQIFDKERKSVTDMSFNSKNGDILAVSYGIYSFTAMHVPQKGVVCVWSIKNPVNPERRYFYNVPVVSVKFSPYLPTLLAVGLYDGSVEVRDITYPHTLPIAVSQRSTSPGVEPVMAIQWIKQTESDDTGEIDPFLTLSQDGSVTKFRIIRSPFLLGSKQMVLERVEGVPEGLFVKRNDKLDQQANRHPQGLNLTIHPLFKDIYYVLTDEGCLYKCSTNYTHQYLEVWKAHKAAVTCMDFSPWSPKLFLTCGNDWCIRIWIDGIFKPLLTLKSQMAPVHCAYWSQTHSTIILAINRKTFDIWDIRRNLLQPVSSTQLGSSYHTMARISLCGRNVAIGTERGSVIMAAIDDLPFPPHFQYNELEKALYKAISTYPDLIIELKGIGFFGYPKKAYMKPQ